jgi:peptidoglycan/xylan/chitin deacetylase (PgdA/CDA1 family)
LASANGIEFLKVLSNGISPLRKWLRRKVIVSFKSTDSVALTFDDGPDPLYTPQVLDVLRRHGAKATFFVLGRQAEMYPRVIQQIVKSGCEIANHSYSHPSFSLISLRERVDEIRRCQSAIGSAGKMYFRPPFGHANFETPLWASLLGYTTVCWSVDAKDWETEDSNVMLDLLEENAVPGSIILLHDRIETAVDSKFFARDAMLEALDRFLDKSNLRFKTLGEMFASCATIESEWDRHFPTSQLTVREQEFLSLVRNTP